MAWVGALRVVIGVATCAGVWRVVVVTLVTIVTGHGRVCACERPHGAVVEGGRNPCILVVTIGTGSGELLSDVVGVCGGVEVINVASCTCIGWIVIVALVAIVAAHTCMRAHNRVEGVIEGGRCPRCLVVAVCTVCRELLSDVVGVCCGIVVIGVTTCTGIGCIIIIAVVAGCTVV